MQAYANSWDGNEVDNSIGYNADQASTTESKNPPPMGSQEVLSWTVQDVINWIEQIGFSEFKEIFKVKGVDGHLLLSLSPKNFRNSIGIDSSLLLNRFMREMAILKQSTSFTNQDHTNLREFLMSIDPQFSMYTFPMLMAGVDRSCLTSLSEDQLTCECGITNSIHRRKIMEAINDDKQLMQIVLRDATVNENLDGFISYRRSNGSELASLIHLKLERLGHSIFLDTEHLGPGKFDNNLKQNIKLAKNFLLVLTPNALDRCIGDNECNDWVHKEIVTAIEFNCNIIPILDNFQWPDVNTLPDDIRIITKYNSITWEHENIDENVYWLDKFMWRNDTESDVTQVDRSASFSSKGESGVSKPESTKINKSYPCLSISSCKSEFTFENTDCENCLMENRSKSSMELAIDALDPSALLIYNANEHSGNVLPSNTLEIDLEKEEHTAIKKSKSYKVDAINKTNKFWNIFRRFIARTPSGKPVPYP